MRITSSSLRMLGLAAGITTLLSCSSETTSENSPPSLAETQVLRFTIAPSVVTAPGPRSYTYEVYMGASYPSFKPWGVRTCPTASITGCTAAWTTVYGTTINTYYNRISRTLSENCANSERMTFQVRAQASAFGVPTQTAYAVTKLCRGV